MHDISVFGKIACASGAMGFGLGDRYWFRRMWNWLGFRIDEENLGFTAKTVPLESRAGNMPLNEKLEPKEWFPKCVVFQFFRHHGLNSVSLVGPSLPTALNMGMWQARKKPFFISVMPLEKTPEKRLDEMKKIIDLIGQHLPEFQTNIGLEMNMSCPNIPGHKPSKSIKETEQMLEIASPLCIPLVPKYSIASAPVEAVMELNDNPHCAGIAVSNTVSYGWNSEKINWEKIFGSKRSPLAKLGGGGYSGPKLLPFVCRWIAELRDRGFTKHIRGGGGIFNTVDVDKYWKAGTSQCILGTALTLLPPWQVNKLIRHANTLTWR